MLQRLFSEHPASVGESYFEHMGMAFGFSGRMALGACACALHGLFPFLCTKTGSSTINELHHSMVSHRVVAERAPASTAPRSPQAAT